MKRLSVLAVTPEPTTGVLTETSSMVTSSAPVGTALVSQFAGVSQADEAEPSQLLAASALAGRMADAAVAKSVAKSGKRACTVFSPLAFALNARRRSAACPIPICAPRPVNELIQSPRFTQLGFHQPERS